MNCIDCKKAFKPGRNNNGAQFVRCPKCRKTRSDRAEALRMGLVKSKRKDAVQPRRNGNGKQPPHDCPVCGEPRSIRSLCRCERELSEEELERDYRRRFKLNKHGEGL